MSKTISKLSKKAVLEGSVRITKLWSFSHLSWFLLFFVFGSFALPVKGQEASKAYLERVSISDRDIADTISAFKTDDIGRSISKFRKKLERSVTPENVRAKVLKQILRKWGRIRIKDPVLEKSIKKLINPVLALYGREDVYRLVILKHKTPYIMSHSGGVLLATTGIFVDAKNDDEILSSVAHEVAHEYFADYSKYTEHLIKIVHLNGKENALTRRFFDVMALLELQCDAFSSITLAHLGYDPLAVVDFLDRLNQTYPVDPNAYHPPSRIRKEVMLGVLPGEYARDLPKRKSTTLFLELKQRTRSLNRPALKLKPLHGFIPKFKH